MNDRDTLFDFLNIPLQDSNKVLDRFAALPNAIRRGEGAEQFVFIKGSRENKILLVAHADTVWQGDEPCKFQLEVKAGVIMNRYGGLGADDRAGCAIVWLLRNMGHSILITAGEECGGIGSNFLMLNNRDIREEIDKHSFVLELDRRYATEYKCYDVATREFKDYIEQATGYTESREGGFTDICVLCRTICGVNLSVGYYNAHTTSEYLVYDEWQNTLDLCRVWLKLEMPRFELDTEEAIKEYWRKRAA